ncbi:MAG: glycosyltransferase family 2 protein [Anaerolineae bacterium]|nr:glycosyltransferase family 2 protein [Anaerolineae bacterium]
MDVSVIVPTYNRREMVCKTICSLIEQTYPMARFETIVTDDGSTDGTREAIAALNVPFRIRYLWQPNRGRCAARNVGVRNASGEIVLFLDSDSLATSNLLEEHVKAYNEHDGIFVRGERRVLSSLVGFSSPFVEFYLAPMEPFPRNLIGEGGFISPTHAHTANLSALHSDLTQVGLFDDSFDQGRSWDDTDLGYRLARMGRRLLYCSTAVVYDIGVVADARAYCERAWQSGYDVHRLFHKFSDLQEMLPLFLDKMPVNWRKDAPRRIAKKIARRVASCDPSLSLLLWATGLLERHWPEPLLLRPLYRWVIGGYIYRGYQDGLRERAVEG